MKTDNAKSIKVTLNAWHKDPSNWNWGLFYYNKNDKRIFPPKKFAAFGWTVNFANPYSRFVMIAVLVCMVAIVSLIRFSN
jgi:uncharacterized membrane protein